MLGHRAEGAQCSEVSAEVRERAAGALGNVPGEAVGGAGKRNLTPELILIRQRCIAEVHNTLAALVLISWPGPCMPSKS